MAVISTGENLGLPAAPILGEYNASVVTGFSFLTVGYGCNDNRFDRTGGGVRRRALDTIDATQPATFTSPGPQKGGTAGLCNGDSGGPALFNNVVVGVNSGSYWDGSGRVTRNVYARIDDLSPWFDGLGLGIRFHNPASAPRVFDANFYLWANADLHNAFGDDGARALRHWISNGVAEGRGASPAFDPTYYLAANPDVQNAYGPQNRGAAIDHWIFAGVREGRPSSRNFNARYYLEHYPDLVAAFGANGYEQAFEHYLSDGLREGRAASAEFDPRFYMAQNPDVAAAYGAENYPAALTHWLAHGRAEGRRGSP